MLEYAFMQKAFIAGMVLAVALPTIGVTVVLKHLSMTGDALSHCSLAGVAGGLLVGINPVIGAMVACLGATIGIETVRRRIPEYADISIAVVAAAGMGLAGTLAAFTGNSSNLNSFLFGSIVAVSDAETISVVLLGCAAVAYALVFRRALFCMAVDERLARTCGIRTGWVNLGFAIAIALVISISARVIGALIVSSMLVVPVACALQTSRSYRGLQVQAVVFALASTVGGLSASFYFGLKPGGAIVLMETALLVVILVGRGMIAKGKLGPFADRRYR